MEPLVRLISTDNDPPLALDTLLSMIEDVWEEAKVMAKLADMQSRSVVDKDE